MTASLAELGARYCAWESTDRNDFQRRARILQSMWREAHGYAMGEHRGRPLGSRLTMPWAKETLANYLTDTIKAVVREEVIDAPKDSGKLFGQPRIFNDLLSSQPLCFNLFAELKKDLPLASAAFSGLTAGRAGQITRLEFEHSPGRGEARYTGDRSAFDVYVEYRSPSGEAGFIGIEVKYHESLDGVASPHRERYDEIARTMACFRPESLPGLLVQPLQQVWRDHLLAGSLLAEGRFHEGLFVFLYPEQNHACRDAVAVVSSCPPPCASTPPPCDPLLWRLLGRVPGATPRAPGGHGR